MMRLEPMIRRGLGLVLLLGLLLGSGSHAWAQFGPASVAVSTVVQREIASGQSFVGTIRPSRISTIGSAVDGRVEELYVNEGDRIEKGKPIAKLRSKTLELERDAAQAMLEMYQAELNELENGSRPAEIEAARANLAVAEARAEFTRAKLKRTRTLYTNQRTVSEEELQEAVSAAAQAEQQVNQSKAEFALIQEGPRKEKIAQNKAKVLSQQEVVNRLNDQIALHTIRAPFDGYITVEHTEVGFWQKRGDAVVEMIELDEVDVEIQVNEDAITGVTIGSSVRVEISAIPDRVFEGTIAFIVPQANPRSRTFPVKIRLKNSVVNGSPLLKSNLFARATLPVGAKEKMLLVPKDAIVLGGPSPMVFIVDASPMDATKSIAKPVPVQLGITQGGLIQVKAPLQPGQKVIVQGNERLFPMAPVIVQREYAPDKVGPQKSVLDPLVPNAP